MMTEKPGEGKIFVFSAPSGTGKTSLARKLVENMEGLEFSVSHTTRSPRPGELDGKDYFFVDSILFRKMIDRGEFLEWAQVFTDFYGTSEKHVLSALASGLDMILDIDEQGALQVKRLLGEKAVLVMIVPPSILELEKRLRGRDKENSAKTIPRIRSADSVLRQYRAYDYIVVNDEFENAFLQLHSIIRSERNRRERMAGIVRELLRDFENWKSSNGEKNG